MKKSQMLKMIFFKLSKHIHQASWYKFVAMLEYKAKWYGRVLVKVDRFFPISKLCSQWGYKNDNLKLSDRKWICPQCDTTHNKNYNAALNLLKEGLRKQRVECSCLYACGGSSGGVVCKYD